MRIREFAPDPEKLKRLQDKAAGSPVAYRRRLVMLALFGDVMLTGIQIPPWTLPVGIGMLLYNSPYTHVGGALVIVFMIWVLRPTTRSRGRLINRADAPALFDAIEALKQTIDMRGVLEVRVDDSMNASAAETRGLFGVLGTRRVLTLGVPLLARLDRAQLLAVLAHEFGHFSRRHGRWGHWLYRAHGGWIEYAQDVDADSTILEKGAATFAQRFVPMFNLRAMVHSRQCEYEADADAAQAVGAPQFGNALAAVALSSIWMETEFPRLLDRWHAECPSAPADFHARTALACAAEDAATTQRLLAAALAESAHWRDTHPTLRERLDALKVTPLTRKAEPGQCAGASLLGETWNELLAESNANWLTEHGATWRCEHAKQVYLSGPLRGASDAEASSWDCERQLARAQAIAAAEPERGLALLRNLQTGHSDSLAVRFALGAALLADDDVSGVSLVEGTATKDATYRVPAYVALARFWRQRGDAGQVEHWLHRTERARQRRATTVNTFATQLALGELKPSAPDAIIGRVLFDAFAYDGDIDRAWLLAASVELATNESPNAAKLSIVALVLSIAPSASEDIVARRYHDSLISMLPVNVQALIKTSFVTETISPALQAILDSMPATARYERPERMAQDSATPS